MSRRGNKTLFSGLCSPLQISLLTYCWTMQGSRASSLWQLGLAASLFGYISVISSAENHIHLRGAEDRRLQHMGFVPAQSSLSFTSTLKSTCSFNLRRPFAANNGKFLLRSAPSESNNCFQNKQKQYRLIISHIFKVDEFSSITGLL